VFKIGIALAKDGCERQTSSPWRGITFDGSIDTLPEFGNDVWVYHGALVFRCVLWPCLCIAFTAGGWFGDI